ncbi:MAG: hypothetical protein E7564_10675 [Ruminococcaceae bacterium]|nr:hypothetical protein [Oscillospiraceae bacterium]
MERTVYKHTVLVGIDGMGNFNRFCNTPNMDRIFENYAKTYHALSMDPTISAENWASMLLGANPVVHKYTNSNIGRIRNTNEKLPSIFKRIKEKMPESKLASYPAWGAINYGVVEENLEIDRLSQRFLPDIPLCDEILKCIETKPNFLFIQFEEVDGAGHESVYGKEEHLKKIEQSDMLVGKVYEAYEKAGIIDDTLFLVITDHGGIRNGHGGFTNEEKYVFIAAAGKNVPKGEIGYMRTKDIAAVILYSLGLDVPEYDEQGFSAQIPDGIFPEIKGAYKIPVQKEIIINTEKTPDIKSEKGLYRFIPENKVKAAFFFDNNTLDAAGKNNTVEHGVVKYYSTGIYSSRGELGRTGYITLPDFKFGSESFTISAWLRNDSSIDEPPAICGTKDWYWKNRSEKGFMFSMRARSSMFVIGNGESQLEIITPFPEDVADGWIHVAVSVDREKNQLRFYHNFKLANVRTLEEKFRINLDTQFPFTIGNDGPGTYNNEKYDLIFNMDDLLIFSEAFENTDIEKLKNYYNFN